MLSVIVVAAGKGTRMGADRNKLLLPLAGEPILCRTLERLHACEIIEELILVAHSEEICLWQEMRLQERFPRLSGIVPGGATRTASVKAGLAAVDSRAAWVAIHDGARPLVRQDELERLFATRVQAQAALLATPVKETIKRGLDAGENAYVQETVPRHELWQAQTPQLFAKEVITAAYAACNEQEREFTDDASVVEAIGVPVLLVPGSTGNIKITTPEDLVLAEQIWRWQNDACRHGI